MPVKLAYLMRHGNGFNIGALREMIYDAFTAALDGELSGASALVIHGLVAALYNYRMADEPELGEPEKWEKTYFDKPEEAEQYFCDRLRAIFKANKLNADLMEDYCSWPDELDLNATWDRELLNELAAIQAGRDLVVRDQLRQLAESERAKEAAAKAE